MSLSFLLFLMFLCMSSASGQSYENSKELMPEFYSALENITATQGRDVHFTCIVNHLGNYRVAWIKSDTKAILAIHNRMVANNPRLSVTHNGHNTWILHIANIQKWDAGTFMCQINTDPMMSQIGYLNVTVPPDILNDEDEPQEGYQALEGGNIRIKCVATGEPLPEVSWKREDGKPIVIRSDKGLEVRNVVYGETLLLSRVNRSDMGIYLCLAKSSVPPIMSKRYDVRVNFKPWIDVTNQLVATPTDRDVLLQCKIEASPKPTLQWMNNRGEPMMNSSKARVTDMKMNEYTFFMTVVVKSLNEKDFGEYSCVAENTIGRAEGKSRLRELPRERTTAKGSEMKTHRPRKFTTNVPFSTKEEITGKVHSVQWFTTTFSITTTSTFRNEGGKSKAKAVDNDEKGTGDDEKPSSAGSISKVGIIPLFLNVLYFPGLKTLGF